MDAEIEPTREQWEAFKRAAPKWRYLSYGRFVDLWKAMREVGL